MVKIKRQLISNTSNKSGTRNTRKFITIHLTGNTSRGANAQAHANLQSNGNSRSANWHWQVDDTQAIQSFDHKFQLWHAGDGGYGSGTLESIAIEGCVNSDGNYNKMISNLIDLVVYIMKTENIQSTNSVVTHNWWSGKYCPTQILNGLNGWTYNAIIAEVNRRKGNKVVTPAPSKPTKKTSNYSDRTIATQVINGLWGNGAERKRRLENAGYNFNKIQGLVNDILSGGKSKTQSLSNEQGSNKSIKTMASEVIAGKHGTGHANRQRSLGVNSATYAKVRAEVNRRAGGGSGAPRGKSISQMATEVLNGQHGNGHANRQQSLGVNNATYQKVRNEVNRRS